MHAASPRRSSPSATAPRGSWRSPGPPSRSRPQGRRSVTGPLVTVVVLNYNGGRRVPGVLEALAAQDLPEGQLEVWVVDNASSDGSLELLRRDFPRGRTIANPTHDGFAGGNNLPPREGATPFGDVLNNAGSMVFRDGYGADRAYQELDRGQYQRPEEVFAFCGGSVCFRTQALREAGMFDDDFFLYYEDTDLSWRLRSLGWSIRYQPSAVVRHIHSASSVEWSPLFTFHTDRNRLLMLTKNARAGLAVREVLRYPVTTGKYVGRDLIRARHARRRPPVRPTLLRLRVLGSYLRLLPVMLVRRRRLAARARVDRKHLERWLVLR